MARDKLSTVRQVDRPIVAAGAIDNAFAVAVAAAVSVARRAVVPQVAAAGLALSRGRPAEVELQLRPAADRKPLQVSPDCRHRLWCLSPLTNHDQFIQSMGWCSLWALYTDTPFLRSRSMRNPYNS